MRPEPQFVGVSDPELLHALCMDGEDDAHYNELIRRFLPEVKKQCKRKCELQNLDPHIGETISHEVFERVRKFKSFDKSKVVRGDGRAVVLAYLSRIATRLFLNHHDKQKRQEELPDSYIDDLRTEARAIDPVRLMEIKMNTAKALKKLRPRELAVVLADLDHKKHTKYLPDEVTLELANQLGVMPDTIRKLRQRAKEKINQALHEINEA